MKKALLLALLPAIALADAPHWEWCGWGGGGFFWSSCADPKNPNVFYLGGDVAGVYKSTDRGRSWHFINNGLPHYAVYSMAVSESQPNTVYAMTGNGIARSADGGAHWTRLAATMGAGLALNSDREWSTRSIAVSPADPKTVYAGVRSGTVMKSSDGGDTWTELGYLSGNIGENRPDVTAVPTILVDGPRGARVFVVNAGHGLFRSLDAGATWKRLDAPAGIRNIAAAKRNPAVLYAACRGNGVWKSVDGGESWTATAPIANGALDPIEVAVDPRSPDVVHAVGSKAGDFWHGLHAVSRDGGATWAVSSTFKRDVVGSPTLPAEVGDMGALRNISVSPANPDTVFVTGSWNNIISYDGGRTWTESSRGADITCFHDIRFLGGDVYGVAMDEGLLRSSDNGRTWTQLLPMSYTPGVSGHQWRVLPQRLPNGGTRIVTCVSAWRTGVEYPPQVFRSLDSGKTFQKASGLPDYAIHPNTMWGEGYPRALAADPANPDVLYLGIDGDPEPGRSGGGVFKSADGGATWTQLPAQPGSRRMFYGLAVDPENPRRLYWGACGNGSGVYVSEDAGESWTHTSLTDWIFNVEAGPDGLVLAGGSALWVSTDHGATWKFAFNGNGCSVCGIAIDPGNPKRFWISRLTWSDNDEGGIYETTDGGETWTDITGDTPYRRPLVLRYNPARHELWSAGVGAFKTRR